MMRYWGDFNIGMLSLIPLSSWCSEVVFYSILVWNCIQIVFELAASKYSYSRNSYCLLTSFWPETRHETHTRNKKLVFSSFVSPIRWTQYEFLETKNPKLVFYRTYKEWPKDAFFGHCTRISRNEDLVFRLRFSGVIRSGLILELPQVASLFPEYSRKKREIILEIDFSCGNVFFLKYWIHRP